MIEDKRLEELMTSDDMTSVERNELLRVYRLVKDAPEVAITECNQMAGASDFDHGDLTAAVQQFKPGQRVRLVPDTPAKEGADE